LEVVVGQTLYLLTDAIAVYIAVSVQALNDARFMSQSARAVIPLVQNVGVRLVVNASVLYALRLQYVRVVVCVKRRSIRLLAFVPNNVTRTRTTFSRVGSVFESSRPNLLRAVVCASEYPKHRLALVVKQS
jgi:hypothetical protein